MESTLAPSAGTLGHSSAFSQTKQTRELNPSAFSQTKNTWDIEPCQSEQIDSLEWQCAFTEALLGYSGAMNSAFEFLGMANKMLRKRGRGNNDMEQALLECFGDAAAMTSALTETMRMPLEACRATLKACQNDVQQASLAAAQMEKTSNKLKSLTAKKGTKESKVKSARDKLDQAMHASSVSRTRAEDALRGCMLREHELCSLARKLMNGTAQALHCAVWPLEPTTPRPVCDCFGASDDMRSTSASTPPAEEATASPRSVSNSSNEGDRGEGENLEASTAAEAVESKIFVADSSLSYSVSSCGAREEGAEGERAHLEKEEVMGSPAHVARSPSSSALSHREGQDEEGILASSLPFNDCGNPFGRKNADLLQEENLNS